MDDTLITGVGAVSCLGWGAAALWNGMHRPARDPAPVPDTFADFPIRHMYQVDADCADDCRSTRFALAAAQEAITTARLTDTAGDRIAVVLGTQSGPDFRDERTRARGEAPVEVPGAAERIAVLAGATGGATTISAACAAGGYAIGIAADMIAAGEVDVVVAGGTEEYSRVVLGCFNQMRALDSERCRPFDRNRGGTVLGEGAAFVVLESARRHAARRGPAPLAVLAGSGWSCDAHHLTAPDPTGEQIVASAGDALARAGADVKDLSLLVPHGTGTHADLVEARAMTALLAGWRVPTLDLKSKIGHTAGAAGAFATVAAALSLSARRMPPNLPPLDPDPDCPIWLPSSETALIGTHALVNAFAFGGTNISLVLREAR